MEKCAICGKRKALVDGYCLGCFVHKNPVVKRVKPLKILLCSNCGAYSTHRGFKKGGNLREVVLAALRQSLKLNRRYTEVHYSVHLALPEPPKKPQAKLSGEAEVTVKAKLDSHPVKEIYLFPVQIKTGRCQKCSRELSKYYEGILQLRNTDSDSYQAAIDFVKASLEKAKPQGIFATKYTQVRNGINIYLTDKKYTQKLAKQVSSNFGGIIKSNPSLVTKDRQTSRRVYRVAVLVRLPEFSAGDLLQIDHSLLLVSQVSGKRVMGTVLGEKKVRGFDYMDRDYQLLARKGEFKETTVSKVHPELEVLHPDTYQGVKVQNPQQNLAPGQKVKVYAGKGVWLVGK